MNTPAISSAAPHLIQARQVKVSSFRLGSLLLLLATTPSLAMMLLHASSQALGLSIALSVIVVVVAAGAGFRVRIATLTKQTCVLASLAAACLLHGAIAAFVTGAFDWSRALSSLILVAFIYIGAYSVQLAVEAMPAHHIVVAMRACFVIFVIEGMLALLGMPALAPTLHHQPVIFFIEPSHYFLAFLPFVTFMVIGERGVVRLFAIFVTLLLGVLIKSLTTLVGVAVAVFLVMSVRHLLILGLIIFPLSAMVETSYFMSRLVFSDEIDNLSTLAYLQGWERAFLNFKSTFAVGVGFQQFGLVGELGSFQERIELLFASSGNINLLDGGSNGSKLIGEFGLIGVLALLCYLGLTLFSIKGLRNMKNSCARPVHQQFFATCLLAGFTEFFVRGVGYMSSGMFLVMVGTIWYVRGYYSKSETAH